MTTHRTPTRSRTARLWILAGIASVVSVLLALGVGFTLLRPGRAATSGHAPPRVTSYHRPTSPPPTAAPAPAWRVAWGSTMGWGYGTAYDTTVRELATVAVGGSAVRVRVSNLFGNHPLVVAAATVGDATGADAAVSAMSMRQLSFAGGAGVTVPPGGSAYSDGIPLPVAAGQELAVSLFVSGPDLMTVHPCCSGPVVSYFTRNGGGNLTATPSGAGFAYASAWHRLVDAIDVLAPAGTPGSIVVVGDSISDGFNSTLRWTDALQRRIDRLPPGERPAVVNEALTANALTDMTPSDATTGGGPAGLLRLGPDALDQPGVAEVILFLGTNDLFFGASADQVIAGLGQAIAATHAAGIRIVGVTLLPRLGSERWNPTRQGYLEQVNEWILTSHAFDAVLNMASVVADMYDGACVPTALFPPYDSGDHLHPNAAGATALANSVDTTLLGLPPAPLIPETGAPTPTPGCAGVTGIPPPA